MRTLKILLLVVAFFLPSISLGQTTTSAKPGDDLIGAWIVSLDGETRTRVLKILNVTQKSDGVLLLDAVYGFTDGNQSKVSAEMNLTAQGKKLVVINSLGTKIDTTEISTGKYVGTFTLKNGTPKGVTISRISEVEFQSAQKSAVLNAVPNIEKSAADVPASCALFPGAWTGTWRTIGKTWLWITAVDTNCVAKYSYGTLSIPSNFKTTTIRNGVLTHTIPAGDVRFELRGEELLGRFVGSSGDQSSVVYQKFQLSSDPLVNLEKLREEQRLVEVVAVTPPGADVPTPCAAFFGSWIGTWRVGGFGEQRLRVIGVDTGCVAKFSYADANMPTRIFETAEIKGGVLSFICNKSTSGTCNFRRSGDTMSADYSNPSGGSNSGAFKKTQ